MADDRQVRDAFQQLLKREGDDMADEEVQYFELVCLSITPTDPGERAKNWAWIILCRRCMMFRDFAEKGNDWYTGATPAMTDRAFGKKFGQRGEQRDKLDKSGRPKQREKLDQFGRAIEQRDKLDYYHITTVVKDTDDKEHFMLMLDESQQGQRRIFVRSTNRHELLQHIRMCWQVAMMYGDEKREGEVKILKELEAKVKRNPEQRTLVQPLYRYRWETFQGYKFMVPYEFGSAAQVIRAGSAIKFSKSDARPEDTASVSIFVHPKLTFERLKILQRDHIRWVAAEYKKHLIQDAANFHVLTYASRQKRMNLSGDICSWHMWEIQLRTKSEAIAAIVLRRLYLPPLCNSAQDIGIVLRCPSRDRATSAVLAEQAQRIADTLSPDSTAFHIYTDLVQAKLDALRYDEGGMEWIEAQLRDSPSHKKPGEEVKIGKWVKAVEKIEHVYDPDGKSGKQEVPKDTYGKALRFNPELQTWRIAWYMETSKDKGENVAAYDKPLGNAFSAEVNLPGKAKEFTRNEIRIRKRTCALLEVQDDKVVLKEQPEVYNFASKWKDEDEAESRKTTAKRAGLARVVPGMEMAARAFVRRLLNLWLTSSPVQKYLRQGHGEGHHNAPNKSGDEFKRYQLAHLFKVMGKQVEDHFLKSAKSLERKGSDMAEFLSMFSDGKEINKHLDIQTGLENFSTKPEFQWPVNEKDKMGIDATGDVGDGERCKVCGSSKGSARHAERDTKATGERASEQKWCVGSSVDLHEGRGKHETKWHCFKMCFTCWRARNMWVKRVASYFAWAVDGGILGSRFPIPDGGEEVNEHDEPVQRYGSLLDVMLEKDVWDLLDAPRKKDLHVALYFMLHMRQTDVKRTYDGELHVIGLPKPDDDCNGLYKFCGLSKRTHGHPWFQKTTKRDVIMYLHDPKDCEDNLPTWSAVLPEPNEPYWVVVKKRQDPIRQPPNPEDSIRQDPRNSEPEGDLVLYTKADLPGEQEESLLAWPPHGDSRGHSHGDSHGHPQGGEAPGGHHETHHHHGGAAGHDGPRKDTKWTWSRLCVSSTKLASDTKMYSGVYCFSNVLPDNPRKAAWSREGGRQVLEGEINPKEGHKFKVHGKEHIAFDEKKVILRDWCVYSYADGEIMLLYQQVQYVIMKNWEFNDRVMMMLLSKRYFSKTYQEEGKERRFPPILDHGPVGGGAVPDQAVDNAATETAFTPPQTQAVAPQATGRTGAPPSKEAVAKEQVDEKTNMEDRVRCLGKLIDSNASLDLQAYVCKTLMDMRYPDGRELDEDLCVLTLDSLVKLLKKENLFIATYATAALVNLSKDRSLVKGTLLGLGIAELIMKNLSTRDEDLMYYTLMLVAHLTKEAPHRNVMTDSGLVPQLYDMLLAAYAMFKPTYSSSHKVSVRGLEGDCEKFNGSYTRQVDMSKDGGEYDCDPKYYAADSNVQAFLYIYPKRKQLFFCFTHDIRETQYDDVGTVYAYIVATGKQEDGLPNLKLPAKAKWTATELLHRQKSDRGGHFLPAELKISESHGKVSVSSAKHEWWHDEITGEYELQEYSEERPEPFYKKAASSDPSSKDIYIIGIPGFKWWCIGTDRPVKNDSDPPQPVDIPKTAVAWNLIDHPEEEEYPPTDHWDVIHTRDAGDGTDEAVDVGIPRVSTQILPSKEKLLVQICIVLGQLANEEHFRKLLLYNHRPEDSSDEAAMRSCKKYTMDCLVYMFNQVIGLGDNLPDEDFNLKYQASLAKVVFAIKQLCAGDNYQKKEVGKSVIQPLVRALYHYHPQDKLHKEFVFQSFIILQMLSGMWDNMLLMIKVKPTDPLVIQAMKNDPSSKHLVTEALDRIRDHECKKAIGHDEWDVKIDILKKDIRAVTERLKEREEIEAQTG